MTSAAGVLTVRDTCTAATKAGVAAGAILIMGDLASASVGDLYWAGYPYLYGYYGPA